ncbi:hypothetical protein BHM03_00025330 [Ensete ventricosum]|uniref:Uncharacterized protein n=1 Tax=Ensete ventricosum TaxID=4639 RepID=A0A445MH59_ENSVE|nr:hypothetical protein BHM03_00025330 [Ensete ventricosum]
MAIDDTIDARFKAFETRIESRLQELLSKFKRSLSENPNKSQHDKSSNLKGNRSEKYDRGQDTGYPRIKFPRWEDRDPISWISRVEIFFHFHRTPEESKVDISFI